MRKQQKKKATVQSKPSTRATQPKSPEPVKITVQCSIEGCEADAKFSYGYISEAQEPVLVTPCAEHAEAEAARLEITMESFAEVETLQPEKPEKEGGKGHVQNWVKHFPGFPFPVVLLIATCVMRHKKIHFSGSRQMPQDVSYGGSTWHITRYPNDQGYYTLVEKPDAFQEMALIRQRDGAHATWKEASRSLDLAKTRLEELARDGDPQNEADRYNALAAQMEEISVKAGMERDALDEQIQNPRKERKWPIFVNDLPEYIKIEGLEPEE